MAGVSSVAPVILALACWAFLGGAGATAARWQPLASQRLRWQYQLSGTIDTTIQADVFDIDLVDVPSTVFSTLKAQGRRIVCYFSAGSYENWRSDWKALKASLPASTFASLLGSPLDGWPGERWLNIKTPAALDIIKSRIMGPRLQRAKARGCDAVEADNVDAFANSNGLGLTASHQLSYNTWLANTAHANGLAIGLKNDLNQVAALQPLFDFAVNEQCVQYSECNMLDPFLQANKAVFGVEYTGTPSSFCPTVNFKRMSVIKKSLGLTAKPYTSCVPAASSAGLNTTT